MNARQSPRVLRYGVSFCALALSFPCIAQTATSSSTSSAESDDIVVTASRRESTVLDVPYNISAVTGSQLEQSNISSIADLARFIPGVGYIDRGDRAGGTNNTLIIRGLNANPADQGDQPYVAAPTVSTYLGEAPLFVNLRLRDIDRVEVLRGPQGTLYGAGSAGGTVRFLFNRPDPSKGELSVNASGSSTDRSSELSTSADALINFPLDDTLAIRAFGGYERKAGFIDARAIRVLGADGAPKLSDPSDFVASGFETTQRNDVNYSEALFGRIALGWRPTDDIRIELAYMRQHDVVGDQQADTIGFGTGQPYQQYFAIREPLKRDVDLGSFDAEVDFGFATLTSVTSYSHSRSRFTRDVTGLFSTALAGFYGPYPRLTAPEPSTSNDKRFTQELRLVSSDNRVINWVLGAYYNKRDADFTVLESIPGYSQWANVTGFQPGLSTDIAYTLNRNIDFRDRAIFGEFTVKATDRLEATFGARQFWQDFRQGIIQTLPICGIFCGDDAQGTTRGVIDRGFNDQVFKVNLSYKIEENMRVYAIWSQGFRYGGGNALPLTGPFANPPELLDFRPDRITNWEAGLKGRLGRITFSGAAFYIDWRDFQFDTFSPAGGFPMVANGNRARSLGVEVEASGRITDKLDISVGYTFVNAKVTEPFTFGLEQIKDGDPLPATPKHIASIAATYRQELTDTSRLLYNLRGYYQSSSVAAFNATSANFLPIPDYTLWGGSVTYERGPWSVGLFAENIFNDRIVFGGRTPINFGQQFQFQLVNRPRTVGLRVGYRL